MRQQIKIPTSTRLIPKPWNHFSQIIYAVRNSGKMENKIIRGRMIQNDFIPHFWTKFDNHEYKPPKIEALFFSRSQTFNMAGKIDWRRWRMVERPYDILEGFRVLFLVWNHKNNENYVFMWYGWGLGRVLGWELWTKINLIFS